MQVFQQTREARFVVCGRPAYLSDAAIAHQLFSRDIDHHEGEYPCGQRKSCFDHHQFHSLI